MNDQPATPAPQSEAPHDHSHEHVHPHRKTYKAWNAFGVLLLVLVGAAGGFYYAASSNATAPSGAEEGRSNKPATVTDTAIEKVTAVLPGVVVGTSVGPSRNVTVSAPTGFATQATYCDPDAVSAACLKFSLADALGDPTSRNAANAVTVLDITDWLAKDTVLAPNEVSAYAGRYKRADKAAAVAAVRQLTSGAKLDPASVQSGAYFNPYRRNANIVVVRELKYVETKDAVFKGYSFIATQAQQGGTYNPVQYVVMLGIVDGRTVAVSGNFKLNDKLRQEVVGYEDAKLDSATRTSKYEAFDKLYMSSNFKYSDDTVKQGGAGINVISSLMVADAKAN